MIAVRDLEVSRPALRYHGAKFRLAPWLLRFFPPHTCYVEPFGGAAGVLLQKRRSYAEVYNDLDGDVVNFFRTLRNPDTRRLLIEAVTLTPYAREEFDEAWTPSSDPIERARRTAIRAQMGFGSAGAVKGSTGFRTDTRRKYGTAQQLWSEYPSAIAAAGERLVHVLIENRPAVDVITTHDALDTLHFVDPPYVHSTRELRKQGGYRHEMTNADHEQLLRTLSGVAGMVVLCGYESDLYRSLLTGWQSASRSVSASGGRGGVVRTETVWLNPACSAALDSSCGGLLQLFRNAPP